MLFTINIFGSIALVALAISILAFLPKRIVLHWSISGNPNRFGHKYVLAAAAVLPAVIWAALELILGGAQTSESALALLAIRGAMPLLMIVFVVALCFSIAANFKLKFPSWFLLAFVLCSAVGFIGVLVWRLLTYAG